MKKPPLVEIAHRLGATDVCHEDDAIAHCINNRQRLHDSIFETAVGRLVEKYRAVMVGYIEHRFPELSGAGKDEALNRTFDRIWEYIGSGRTLRTVDGSLGNFVALTCQWSARRVLRDEKRRHELLKKQLGGDWYTHRDESEFYKGDAVTEQDLEEVLSALKRAFDPALYPTAAPVLEAVSAIILGTNDLQLRGRAYTANVAAIQNYLDRREMHLSEEEVRRSLEVLRSRAKEILEENGWEVTESSYSKRS
jgi:hypothetical protein